MAEQVLRTDKALTLKEHLTYYLNMFQDKLIANCIDLAHYTRIEIDEPDYKTIQNGQQVSIKDLILGAKKGARLARNNVAHINELIAMEEAGTLAENWSDEKLLDPIEQFNESKKEEGK